LGDESVAKLTEKLVPQQPYVDAIVACGPFICSRDINYGSKEEEDASKIADIGSIIAQLENIVCRVIYLPSQQDPNSIITEENHLTPNSVTLHGRKLMLMNNLYISGYSEPDLTSQKYDFADNEDHAASTLNEIRVQTAKSMDVLREVVGMNSSSSGELTNHSTGIFTLLYRFSHTLNHFLFHLTEELEDAGIELCIICSSNAEEASRLPSKFGNLQIISPGNLQLGCYTLVDLEFDTSIKKWKLASVRNETL
jgi:hypothetical protein